MDALIPGPYGVCDIICKTSGKKCNKHAKLRYEDKLMCTVHYKMHKVKNDDCSICMDIMKTKTSIKVACGHLFHTTCLKKWMQQGKDTCPLCREPLDTQTLITMNKETMDYLGNVIYSLPLHQREQMLCNITHVINITFGLFATGEMVETVPEENSAIQMM